MLYLVTFLRISSSGKLFRSKFLLNFSCCCRLEALRSHREREYHISGLLNILLRKLIKCGIRVPNESRNVAALKAIFVTP